MRTSTMKTDRKTAIRRAAGRRAGAAALGVALLGFSSGLTGCSGSNSDTSLLTVERAIQFGDLDRALGRGRQVQVRWTPSTSWKASIIL